MLGSRKKQRQYCQGVQGMESDSLVSNLSSTTCYLSNLGHLIQVVLSISFLISKIKTIIMIIPIKAIQAIHIQCLALSMTIQFPYQILVDFLELLRNAFSGLSCSGPSLGGEGSILYFLKYSSLLYWTVRGRQLKRGECNSNTFAKATNKGVISRTAQKLYGIKITFQIFNPLSFPFSLTSWLVKVLLCITYTPTFDLNGSAVLKIAEVSAHCCPSPLVLLALVLLAHCCFTPAGIHTGAEGAQQWWGKAFSGHDPGEQPLRIGSVRRRLGGPSS